MEIMELIVFCACVCLGLNGGVAAIQVVEEPMIQAVENGTRDALVLDCPYTLEEKDREGLVITWLRQDSPKPIYQWIVSNGPQALGFLKNRLDLTYEASEDSHHKHSALRILEPTTEFSGQYTCKVSSFYDEKLVHHKLVVYSEPSEMQVWTEEVNEDTVRVVCEAGNVHPEPLLRFHVSSPETERKTHSELKPTKTWSQGTYNVTANLVLEDESLMGPTTFECELVIPDTDVSFKAETLYQPRVTVVEGAVLAGSGTLSALPMLIAIPLLTLLRL